MISTQETLDHRAAHSLAINHSMAILEARRCLYCFDAPCTRACPVHIDVPGFIKRIQEDNLAGSCELLYTANPFARVCGLACPTANLCEGACVLPRMGQRAIQIGALQYFVTSHAEMIESVGESKGNKRVAVLGAGPAGLSCATALRRIGIEVEVFERRSELGGLMSSMIPFHRLPQYVVDADLDRIQSLGFQSHLGANVDGDMLEQIVQDFGAVFIGVGLGSSRTLAIPGMDLQGVMLATEFLEFARRSYDKPSEFQRFGESVAVVGGGNVALDAACVAIRHGIKRVFVLYRRTIAEMPGWKSEYEEAASLGVEFHWRSTVKRVLGRDGSVSGVEIVPMRQTERQADGRYGFEPDPGGSEYELSCDTVLLALGQAIEPELAEQLGLSTKPDGLLDVQPGTYQTSNPKVFAGGEAISGGSTLVQSIAEGMAAGQAIHKFLSEE
jgi:dihydropyrimidine dehydrogenase (NAD+) subunit PreT